MSINLLLTLGTNITKNDKIQTNGSKKTEKPEKPEEKECPSIDETILVNVEDAVLSSGEIVAVET